jgi:chromosome segregation ATPase
VAINYQDEGPDCASESSVNDGQAENDQMMAALKCRLEKQAREGREAQSEHEGVVSSLRAKILVDARDKDDLRTRLHETNKRLQKETEDKCNLSKELHEAKRDEAAARNFEAELDQSVREREELRVKLATLNVSFDQLNKARIDGDARIKTLEADLEKRVDGQNNAHTALQSQHSADMISLKNEIQRLEDEQTNASAAHKSTIDHMEGNLARKDKHIQSLELELAEKAVALASYDVKHAELHSCNIALSEQLSGLREEHRLLGQSNEKMILDGQQLDEVVRKSAAEAQSDHKRIAELETQLGEAEAQVAKFRSETSSTQDKVVELESELVEARERNERHAQIVDREQDTRYDAEVAVMNQKVENAMAREATRRIQEELDQANNRGKEIEDKMKALEGRVQTRGPTLAELTLVSWERVGDVSFTKVYFTCPRENALDCVRSLELCSQENSSKWDYVGFDRRRIPSSMKQDEKYLVDVWIQGGIMGRWLAIHRSFFETRAAQRTDMPIWAERPKLTLKRKSPVALPEDADSRLVKRALPSNSRIEEIE